MLPAFVREVNKLARWPRSSRQALIGAVALWVTPMLVVGMIVTLQPLKRTVTPLYHEAAANWWAGQNLYSGPQGMNYLPHFAMLFSLFHLLPLRLAEVLWRFGAAAMLAGGLWQVVRALFAPKPERAFLWATFLAMPLCMNALRSGQANAVFSGVTLLAAGALLNQRWWLATVLMALATSIKPLGIVLLVLAPVCYGPLRGRVLLAILGMAIFPFLFGSPAYVLAQYYASFTNLQACSVAAEHRFADINGLLRTFGTAFTPEVSRLVRALAGGLALGLWWRTAKLVRQPVQTLWLYSLTAAYLMLFNPMNEENSYVILAPALGVWGAFFLFHPGGQAFRGFGWVISVMALSMGLLPNIVRPLFGNRFALCWHPAMTIVFGAMLTSFIWRLAIPAQDPALPTRMTDI